VRDVTRYEKWRCLRGQDPQYIWRSGIKHDCSKVMEFEPVGDGYKNGLGEFIRCEGDYIYPLLKSLDVGNGRITSYRKVVLITQKAVGEDASQIRKLAPMTWEYLIEHREYLDKRRSTIYRNKPVFSIFGVGDYSFKQWKITVSGFYNEFSPPQGAGYQSDGSLFSRCKRRGIRPTEIKIQSCRATGWKNRSV